MRTNYTKQVGLGGAAGIASTALLQEALAATKRWMPQTLPPMKEEPGKFMVHRVEAVLPESVSDKVSPAVETAASKFLAFGYGSTFGALYGMLPARRRTVVRDGTLLGIATWAAGYLGWLPATGLTPPVWKQEAKQVLPNFATHIVFGLVTAALVNLLRKKL